MIDAQARSQALDPSQSFIVQAPAGSGKTELLTQRYLSLLSSACEFPGEIIAITFTRKAAAQMRERILQSLHMAKDSPSPTTGNPVTWQLAKNALKKDQIKNWSILSNPQQLQILTIDSLSAKLCSRMPLLAGYGAQARIVEDATPYYQLAVQEFLLQSPPVELLAHLDNNTERFIDLSVDLLAKREQWLPYIIAKAPLNLLRAHLEKGLRQCVEDILLAVSKALPEILQKRLLPLCRFAADNLAKKQPAHRILNWRDKIEFPGFSAKDLPAWQGLAQLFLTAEGEWRKSVDARIGFPAKTDQKKAFEEILATLSEHEYLKHLWQQVQICPTPQYSDQQWLILTVLLEIMPNLVAQLQYLFRQHNILDFIEIGLCAARALGEEDHPTDLAFSLDYRIRHLLIDEFQDTSVAHFKFLEKLILGWEPGDGRSIFLVGDPMQSIYRFRNAEVSLFLHVIQNGIQGIPLQPLHLAYNFRSGEQLIAWYNQVFPDIFPKKNDIATGAISYIPAAATQQQNFIPAFTYYVTSDDAAEAEKIVTIIQQCRQEQPGKIAILVRSRTHLQAITPALQQAGIQFQAVEIESLTARSEIQDLTALTRALYHLGDRVAWLAILRAPYCGLTLADILVITEQSQNSTVYESLLRYQQLPQLSADAISRLQRIVAAFNEIFLLRGRLSAAAWVEKAWLVLGGPAGLHHANQLTNAQTFFQLLQQCEHDSLPLNWPVFFHQLDHLYGSPSGTSETDVHIMTIHKAKGLEFDHVILPQLHRKSTSDDSKLFLWMERINSKNVTDLILAPIKETAVESDPVYHYLKTVETQKLLFESARLLYVATTRAKQSLHLLTVKPEKSPVSGSFLHMLWNHFRDLAPETCVTPNSASENKPALSYKRLKADWANRMRRAPDHGWPGHAKLLACPDNLSNRYESHLGTVIHEALAQLTASTDINLCNKHWENRLRQLGLTEAEIVTALSILQQALQNILQDPRGLWILSSEHREARNEYALTTWLDGQFKQVIFDRTFIDAAGVRWIIDYKTGTLTEDLLQSYYQQLQLYGKILSLQEQCPIRLGLYFPLTGYWREWDYCP